MLTKLLYEVAKDWRTAVPELGRILYSVIQSPSDPFLILDMVDSAASGEWIKLAQQALARIPRTYFDSAHGDSRYNTLGYNEAMLLFTVQGTLHKTMEALKKFGIGTVKEPASFSAGVAMFDFTLERLFQSMPKDVVEGAKKDYLKAAADEKPAEACKHEGIKKVSLDPAAPESVSIHCASCHAPIATFLYTWSPHQLGVFYDMATRSAEVLREQDQSRRATPASV